MSEPVFAGIDAGSSATKCVLLTDGGQVLAHEVVPSRFDYGKAADQALCAALAHASCTIEDVLYCVSTGYGRERVSTANRYVTEITCHARGAREWNPEVRHIIDIGGQDTKVIRINARGKMMDYRMNAKCAAGTGTFLESIALKLGVSLLEIDSLAMTCTNSTTLNSYCTVFAGTEVIERIKAGDPSEDIAMGLFRSIATRVLEMMSSRDGVIGATGGVVAHCRAMLRALQEILESPVHLPPMAQHAGSLGAALIAQDDFRSRTASISLSDSHPSAGEPKRRGGHPC